MRPSPWHIAIGVLTLVVPFAAFGCAGGIGGTGDDAEHDRENELTVEQALATSADQPVAVRGYVVVDPDGTAHLCTGLAGSHPPQCAGPSLVLQQFDVSALRRTDSAEGVIWSTGGETTLRGTVDGEVLRVIS